MYAAGGGAYLLAEMTRAATGANILPPRPEMLENRSPDAIVHSILSLRKYPKEREGKSDSKDKVYRVDRFDGYSGPQEVGRVCGVGPTEDSSCAPHLLLIDDGGNGFRHEMDIWPAPLREPRRGQLVLAKIVDPLSRTPLRDHLIAHFHDTLAMVVNADDLRSRLVVAGESKDEPQPSSDGAKISRGVSWERTVADTVRFLEREPSASPLRDVACLIIRYDCDGALVRMRSQSNAQYSLWFDPARIEGDFAASLQGGMTGLCSAFVASLAKDTIESMRVDQLANGAGQAILRSRCLFSLGYATVQSSVAYPCSEVFASSTEPVGPVINVTIDKDKLSENWSIGELNASEDKRVDVREIVRSGIAKLKAALPVATFGDLTVVDRFETEGLRGIRNLMQGYIANPNPEQPLSIAVFGAPGSGKSFGVSQVAASLDPDRITKKDLEFNLTQFLDPRELNRAFHRVRDVILSGKIPLVFFDEFDSKLGDSPLGWLKYFLMPMQDAKFRDGDLVHSIGKCIFVFAGGTAYTFEEFSRSGQPSPRDVTNFRDAKGPDFLSRLRGFVNVRGPNPAEDKDSLLRIRRAILLRSLLLKRTPGLSRSPESVKREKRILDIDDCVIDAFLGVPRYRHGSRSMEAILDMSALAGTCRFTWSRLPTAEQLDLHVDASSFMNLGIYGDKIEKMAKEIHNIYLRGLKSEAEPGDKARRTWEQLTEGLRDSNRLQALDIPNKLKRLNYRIAPLEEPGEEFKGFNKDEIERLAEMEHARWMEERLAMNWKLGDPRDHDRKISPWLIPWKELKDTAKEQADKDRSAVSAIPDLLKKVELKIVKQ